MTDLHLVVSSVIRFLPLQLAVIVYELRRHIVGPDDRDVLSQGRRRSHTGSCKLDPNTATPSRRIVCHITGVRAIEPNEIRDPVLMTVARKEDIVLDVV